MITALMLWAVLAGDVTSEPRAPAQPAPATERVTRARWTLEELLDALRIVETGGEKHGGRRSTGDGGNAIGPYQIHRAYWTDARLPGRYEDCRDPRYARTVVLAYWRRYCPKALEALDAETLARIHNGGPDGNREASTVAFWKKVERELVRAREAREAAARKERERKAPGGDAKPTPKSGPVGLV
jgi:hypothetical protein